MFGIFAVIAVACCGKLPSALEKIALAEAAPRLNKTCPRCAEKVKAAALVCRFCQYEFDLETVPAVEAPDMNPDNFPWTKIEDYGAGFGVYRYKGDKLVYESTGTKWKGNVFATPGEAIAAATKYHA
ncbi:hypothetical protein AX768_02155 [Burkholderia sp. PAMC 28687]|nr:hypothetical protein AX768_02155 [Burkholderia sp. PAMC 28687]